MERCKVCSKQVYLEDTPTYDVDQETGDKYCDDCGILNESIRKHIERNCLTKSQDSTTVQLGVACCGCAKYRRSRPMRRLLTARRELSIRGRIL